MSRRQIKIKYIPEIFPGIDFEENRTFCKAYEITDELIEFNSIRRVTLEPWANYLNSGIFEQLKQAIITERRLLTFPIFSEVNFKFAELTNNVTIIDINGLPINAFNCAVNVEKQSGSASICKFEYSIISSNNITSPVASDNCALLHGAGYRMGKISFYIPKPPYFDWCDLIAYSAGRYYLELNVRAGLTEMITIGTRLFFHCPQTPSIEQIIDTVECYEISSTKIKFRSYASDLSDIGTKAGYVILDAEPKIDSTYSVGTALHSPIIVTIYTMLKPVVQHPFKNGDTISAGDDSLTYTDKISLNHEIYTKFFLKESELWKLDYALIAESVNYNDINGTYYAQQVSGCIKEVGSEKMFDLHEFDFLLKYNFVNISMSR